LTTCRVTGTKEDAKATNAYLDTLHSKVYEAQRCLIEANEIVTAETIKNKLTGICSVTLPIRIYNRAVWYLQCC